MPCPIPWGYGFELRPKISRREFGVPRLGGMYRRSQAEKPHHTCTQDSKAEMWVFKILRLHNYPHRDKTLTRAVEWLDSPKKMHEMRKWPSARSGKPFLRKWSSSLDMVDESKLTGWSARERGDRSWGMEKNICKGSMPGRGSQQGLGRPDHLVEGEWEGMEDGKESRTPYQGLVGYVKITLTVVKVVVIYPGFYSGDL